MAPAPKRKVRIVHDLNDEVDPAVRLALATRPLLELFAMVNDVFEEDDALSQAKRQMSLGRIYESWKKCRKELDRSFSSERDSRAKRYAAGIPRQDNRRTLVPEPDRPVLRARPSGPPRTSGSKRGKRSTG